MTEPAALSTNPTMETPGADLKEYAKQNGIELDFDPTILKMKYAEEKRKRENPQGIAQYQSIRDKDYLNSYTKDLYADEHFSRNPITAVYDVLIIGAGYTGLQAIGFLKQQGITNVCIIEKGDGYGGTWLVLL